MSEKVWVGGDTEIDRYKNTQIYKKIKFKMSQKVAREAEKLERKKEIKRARWKRLLNFKKNPQRLYARATNRSSKI